MTTFFTLIAPSLYLELPESWLGWLGWLSLVGLTFFLLWRWRSYNSMQTLAAGHSASNRMRLLLVGLVAATIFTALFLGFRLPPGSAPPPPGLPRETFTPPVMLLAAVPWMLAAGIFGAWPAAALAFLSGLLQALFDIHNPYYPVELALLAGIFTAAVRQNYRTWFFRVLRSPLGAAALVLLIYPFFATIDMLFITRGVLATRFDYALTHLVNFSLALGIQLLVGALFAIIVRQAMGKRWGTRGSLLPSPAESSLEARFLWAMSPAGLLLLLTLLAGSWIVAGNAAREMLQARMANAANLPAQTLPYFLETGEHLAAQMVRNPALYTTPTSRLDDVLEESLRSIPYFRQVYLFDGSGSLLAGYPASSYLEASASTEELLGLQLALTGVEAQSFSLPPAAGEQVAQVGFIAAHHAPDGEVLGVLLARSDLASNPLAQPALESLASLAEVDGMGLLVDENGRILYHTDPTMVMTQMPGFDRGQPTDFTDETAPDGTRRMAYYQQAQGRDWTVILTVPAHRAQQLALQIAAPLMIMLVIMSAFAWVILRLGLRMVTGSLQNLAQEAGRIAQGQLDRPLAVSGEDEAGQLRRAFEQMRISLKGRLDDLNRLLLVSQGVASSLDMSEAVQPVLESALAGGASSARVVLLPAVVPELEGDADGPVAYGSGKASPTYSYLDEQILALNRQQERLLLTNLSRPRLFQFPAQSPRPEALLAVALRHENNYFGTLWVAYDQPHQFGEEEVRFMVTLAGQAALAAANASLFLNAEIGRQRLAAILASSPDPVLVTGQNDKLLVANPAAWHALGVNLDNGDDRSLDQVIPNPELVRILSAYPSAGETISIETCLPDGRVYLATASSVLAEGQRVGRVCVLRDITHFKELDALKSEFVSTVSHDLRSPLTLMRGYATMLEMVGELNEQQTNYVRKIVTGVESMSRLVNNLLDLGRIEAGIGLQVEMVPAADVLERIVSALQIHASQKRIQLTLEVPRQNPALLEADQALLQQALQNLIENALKYTRTEGKVHVRLEPQGNSLLFAIQDTGIGISPMDQTRVFEKFYRAAQHGAREQRGTGLGLAIVKSIAERHGGRVWVESHLGQGSTFSMELPVKQPR
jgi:PAS domain S-box-containing protein